MIMIKMLRLGVAAHGACVTLRCSHLSDVILGELVSTVEVGGTALGVLTCLAATSEA
jgi:hypothetical protein